MTSTQRTPASRFRYGKVLTLAAAFVLAVPLAACGAQTTPTPPLTSHGGTDAATSSSTTEPPTSAAASSEPSGAPSAATSASPSAVQSTAEPAASEPAATLLCNAASLQGSLDDSGGAAAGNNYTKLIMTNVSTDACILAGYPGVSMVKAGSVTPLGAEAEWDRQAASNGPITLTPGDSAAAILRYTQANNYQNCQRVPADALLVYPPGATNSLEIPRPLTACSNADIKLLTIGAFQQ